MALSDEIKAARKERGLSQNQLAELAGCAQTDIFRLEKGLVAHSRHLAPVLRELALEPAEDGARREAALYRDALCWIVENEDTEWLADENVIMPVTVRLVADVFGKSAVQIVSDLHREIVRRFSKRS